MGLENLEYMESRSNDGEELISFFPSLESLHIEKLGSLKGWCRGEEYMVEKDDDHILRSRLTFRRLSKLKIQSCCNLTSFPSCPILEDLELSQNSNRLRVYINEIDCAGNSQGEVRLKNLKIDDVGYLKSIHSLCLTALYISSDKNVESLSEFGEVFWSCSSSLRSFGISSCSNLKTLGRGGLEHLTALEELELSGNNQLSFSEDKASDDMPWKNLHKSLRSLS